MAETQETAAGANTDVRQWNFNTVAAALYFKTYKKLIKAIGEERDFINGPDYEVLRPKQNAGFEKLVKSLMGK